MVWLSPKESPRVVRVWERADTPFVSFPARRFIPHEEAVAIRMRIYAARLGGPAE